MYTMSLKEGVFDMDKLYDVTAMGELLIDFAMNGQTGEICGQLPVDYRKLLTVCGGIFAAVTALITLLGGLML